jgi:hypothetical protein
MRADCRPCQIVVGDDWLERHAFIWFSVCNLRLTLAVDVQPTAKKCLN